jgi:CubicO group peptidase (beta-lactamase class C family)
MARIPSTSISTSAAMDLTANTGFASRRADDSGLPCMKWQNVNLEDAGLSPDLDEKIGYGIKSGLIRNLHSLVIVKDGKIVVERYHVGDDHNWGKPLGSVQHGIKTLHDLRSVTKSIVGLLYGIALEKGIVPAPETPISSAFAHVKDIKYAGAKARITIAHVLTMSMGIQWDESLPYSDPNNSEIRMEAASDRIRFVLEQPSVHEAGRQWTYSGGATALLASLIERGSGQKLSTFAQTHLFSPLGISHFEWNAGSDGCESAASGLRLTARDLARIGIMLLAGGENIVSKTWIDTSSHGVLPTGEGPWYGQHFWTGLLYVPVLQDELRWYGGFGNGGQRLFVLPARNIVMVAYFGNYDIPLNWIHPSRIWFEILAFAIKD